MTGVLLGVAVACKLWALLLFVPIVATSKGSDRGRALARVLGAAVVATGVLVAPFVILTPGEFVEGTVTYQLERSGEGGSPFGGSRLAEVFFGLEHFTNSRALLGAVVAAVGVLAFAAGRRQDRAMVFGLAWYGTQIAVLLAARSTSSSTPRCSARPQDWPHPVGSTGPSIESVGLARTARAGIG